MENRTIEIEIREVAKEFKDKGELGVTGYSGRLNIRPSYQREFIYDNIKRNAVIDSVLKGLPLNLMYWADNGNNTYELIDGQQRTISICMYVSGIFSININGMEKFFHNLTEAEKEKILSYKLLINICKGTDEEILVWFATINTGGEKLNDQELLNANYCKGPWLNLAKLRFSKTGCAAYNIAKDYIKGSPIRQDFLETVLSWISGGKDKISEYMSKHQYDENSDELWKYFNSVISWVKTVFPKYRKEMKGIQWGLLYNKYKDNKYNSIDLESKIKKFMSDDDVTKKSGIYEYLLSGESNDKERLLSIRLFTSSQIREMYEIQNGKCKCCGKDFEIQDLEADHIKEWSKGGKTKIDNGQLICHECHKKLTATMINN